MLHAVVLVLHVTVFPSPSSAAATYLIAPFAAFQETDAVSESHEVRTLTCVGGQGAWGGGGVYDN